MLTIKDIWRNNSWDLSRLSGNLEETIINKIVAITPSIRNCDIPIWSLTINGLFMTKSCYTLIENPHRNEENFLWIWNLKCPNKLKFLRWKCLHNKFPTRSHLNNICILTIYAHTAKPKEKRSTIFLWNVMQLERYGPS